MKVRGRTTGGRRRAVLTFIGLATVVATLLAAAAGGTAQAAATTLPSSVKVSQWQAPSGDWTTGNNGGTWAEGDTIPFRLELGSVDAGTYAFSICRDYADSGVYGYLKLQPYDTSYDPGVTTSTSEGAFDATSGITFVSVDDTTSRGVCGSNQLETRVTFETDGSTGQVIYWGGYLAAPTDDAPTGGTVPFEHSAGFYPGSSLHMGLASPSKDLPIPPKAIIKKAAVTVTKVVDSGSATPDQWCFTLGGQTLCPASGQSSVTFSDLDTGSYQVTEASGPDGYAFASGSGTNCTFAGSTATAAVTASTNPQNASCTFHNARTTGSVELRKTWVGDPGDVTLKIGSSAGGSDVASTPLSGKDGTTGAKSVGTGTYYVSETVANAGDYSPALACTRNGSSFTPGTQNAVTVGSGDAVVCTFTNTRNQGSLELRKTWVGTPGDVTLAIGTTAGDDDVASKSLSGDGTTGARTLDTGTYYVSESGVDSTLYRSALACVDAANGDATVSAGDNGSVAVGDGQRVVCTYTNTRRQGSLELRKHWVGTAGDVTLQIGTTAGGSGVASQALSGTDGTTGATSVETGTYYVSETGVDAADYTAALACTRNGSAFAPGGDGSVTVGDGDTVVCTYTNTHTLGSLELRKTWVGTAGSVTLKVGTSAGGDDVASKALTADGTTGATSVETGTYYVSETVANAGDYSSALACTRNGSSFTPATGNAITVARGDAVVCTFTNTRVQGSLELRKHWVGTPGDVTLAIGSSPGGSDLASTPLAGKDGTTGAKAVETGTYYVSETVADAGDYTSDLACTRNGAAFTPGANGAVAVGDDDTVVCTYTNTRVQGSLELRKTWVGTAGDVTLKIGTSAGGSDVASTALAGKDGTTGAKAVDTGTYYVSETVTDAGDYAPALSCTNDGAAVTPGQGNALAVGQGDHVVCTFTNHELPKVKVVKTLEPSADAGTFDLAVGGQTFDNGGDGYGDGGTTGFVHLEPGTPTVAETAHGDASLSDYTSSVSCTNGDSGDGTSLTLSRLSYGDAVTCTFANVRKPTITIVKTTLGGDGTFSFRGPGESSYQIATSGGTGSKELTVEPGSYDVAEDLPTGSGWQLTGLSCSTGGTADRAAATASVTVGAGDNVTCTFTNTKLATLVVKKEVDNANGGSKAPGDFELHVTKGGQDVTGSPQAGSSSGTSYALLPGTYQVGEDAVSGYRLDRLSGCLADGSITLAAGETATCTLVNASVAKSSPPPSSPPAPPAPPAPRVDTQITKTAAPNPATVGGQVTWTMVVSNNGPNDATGVTVADPLPGGTSFVSVATTQGTCTGGALVSCRLGTLPVGATVTITLVTRATATGTLVNTATTVATEQETNTANNTATANAAVKGAFVPPVHYCTALAVSPKQLLVGHRKVLTMKVTEHGKRKAGVRVRLKGASVSLVTKRSTRKGVVKQAVKPHKPGIIVFRPVAAKSCRNARVGVIGVFTPPVTG